MTDQQVRAAIAYSLVILESIPEKGCPNGVLYAALMGVMNLDQYNGLLSSLKTIKALKVSPTWLERGSDYEKGLGRLKALEGARK